MQRFRPLVRSASPFVVAQLAFTARTRDGKLRHPTFPGLRDDKRAREVTWSGSRAS